MKHIFSLLLAFLPMLGFAQDFNTYFRDSTLRVDYIFAGDVKHQEISVDKLNMYPR